jgi:putative flippase GtrA
MIIKIKKIYKTFEKNENLRQVATYTVIGSFAVLLDLTLFYIFVNLFNIWYILAAALSFTILAIITFYLHKNFSFRHKGGHNKLRFIIFFLIASGSLLFGSLLLYILVDKFKIWYLTAAVLVKLVVVFWSFLMNKYVTFRILHE